MSLNKNISSEKPRFYNDYVWQGEALPNAGSKTSDPVLGGHAQGSLEYVFKNVNGAILLGGSGVGVVNSSLKIEARAAESYDGPFIHAATLLDVEAGAEKTIEDQAEICKFIPPTDAGPWIEFYISASGNLSSKKIDVFPTLVNR